MAFIAFESFYPENVVRTAKFLVGIEPVAGLTQFGRANSSECHREEEQYGILLPKIVAQLDQFEAIGGL